MTFYVSHSVTVCVNRIPKEENKSCIPYRKRCQITIIELNFIFNPTWKPHEGKHFTFSFLFAQQMAIPIVNVNIKYLKVELLYTLRLYINLHDFLIGIQCSRAFTNPTNTLLYEHVLASNKQILYSIYKIRVREIYRICEIFRIKSD